MEQSYITLGIETSCDETAAAVYSSTQKLLSSITYSQIALHKKQGGVVPEIASRAQLEKINEILSQALAQAHVSLADVAVIAVTHKPGLPGSLLVGVCFAKAAVWSLGKKLIGIDHLEGHIFSPFLENTPEFPHICLSASGGHTALYYVEDFGKYTLLGHTIDDAAGEAFDKIAKLMNLGYPGGPIMEILAQKAHFIDYFRYPRAHTQGLDFSFSGLKTAILYDLVKRNAYDLKTKQFLSSDNQELIMQVASSLHVCVADIFAHKIKSALAVYPQAKAVTFVGGVACNQYITSALKKMVQATGRSFYFPSKEYCTDNAAMIAFVGNYKAQQEKYSDWTLDILR